MNISGGGSVNASGPCGLTQLICLHGASCVEKQAPGGGPTEGVVALNTTASDGYNPGASEECACPLGWTGDDCSQLNLFRTETITAASGVLLLLCLLCCMAGGDPERRRIAIREKEEGYRTNRLPMETERGCGAR